MSRGFLYCPLSCFLRENLSLELTGWIRLIGCWALGTLLPLCPQHCVINVHCMAVLYWCEDLNSGPPASPSSPLPTKHRVLILIDDYLHSQEVMCVSRQFFFVQCGPEKPKNKSWTHLLQTAWINERGLNKEYNSEARKLPNPGSWAIRLCGLSLKVHVFFWALIIYVIVLKEKFKIDLAHSWLKDKQTQSTNTDTWEIASRRSVYLFLNTFCLFAYLSASPKARAVSF